jgi:hypothetical protein
MDTIFNNTNFITGFRAFDVCRNKTIVSKIRAINNQNYDIDNNNFNNVFYNEDVVNRKTIPYIHGNIDSFINFPDIIKYPRYSICLISKYNGNNNNTVVNIVNPNNKVSSFGHNNKIAGVVEYSNSSTSNLYTSKNNLNNEWVITCVSYDSIKENESKGITYIGNNDINYNNYNYSDIQAIIGKLNINNSSNPSLNSDWALSHLFIWDIALPDNVLKFIYSTMTAYLKNPADNDIILYNNYPRNLPSCVERIYKPPTRFINTALNVKTPWAVYFPGNYNRELNVLPDTLGNVARNITDMKNIKFDYINNSLYGGLDSYIKFPDNSINSNFTICSITKYTSTNKDYNNKILQAFDNSSQFYHGHYKNKTGVIEYDNYEFAKYVPSTNPVNSWVITCAKNTNSPDNVIVNNYSCGLNITSEYLNTKKSPNTLTININKKSDITQNSEWAMSYVVIWDSHLSDAEINLVSNALYNYLTTNELLNFRISNNTPNLLSGNNSAYPGLYLTELQKKMLLY